jgi:type III secretion protein R
MGLFRFCRLKYVPYFLIAWACLWVCQEYVLAQGPSASAEKTESQAQPLPQVAPRQNIPSRILPAAPGKAPAASPAASYIDSGTFKAPSIVTQGAVIAFFALFPFFIMVLTSFMKIVIVLSLLRSALGVQQAPPNQVINGVAFMLSLYIMYPTAMKIYDASQNVVNQMNAPDSLISRESADYIVEIGKVAREPLRDFLQNNVIEKHQREFFRMAYRTLPEAHRDDLKPDDFIILVPSFITGQLKEAFEIGVLIYIPFFVIDLVTSNVLLAMGMMMLSPVTISMPLKLFLLVMLDGWTLLVTGLVTTFR